VGYAISEMKATVAGTELLPATTSRVAFLPIIGALVFFGLLWVEVINHLKAEWSFNPQYGYGWCVPFLAVYLVWKRWPTRPSPAPPASRAVPIALMVFGSLLFFPIRLVAEANPDWRLLSWAFALDAVAISILWLLLVGGWNWVRHFAFPVVFFLVAVPWPMQVEQVVIQGLMRAVTAINVFFLDIAGVPALRHGNVIEVGSGLIGIEEACSGVRSIQATLMISLFLGDLYSFVIARRVLLVIAGGLLAFSCNVVRTTLLVWIGARNGPKSIEAWHDPAGLTILLVCLFGLWAISLIMRRSGGASVASSSTANEPSLLRFSWPLLTSLTLWLVLAESAVQGWYRLHESSIAASRWTVKWPDSENDYQPVTISPEAESLLRYNEGGGASWQTKDGKRWMMYFFRWFPGRAAALFVKIHRPDICLPASGLTMEHDNGIKLLSVNGVNLPVRSYRFDDHGVPLHIFYCYWDARSNYDTVAAAEEEDWSARGRVRAALRGRREIGAQMIEVGIWGCENDAEAESNLGRQLEQTIRKS